MDNEHFEAKVREIRVVLAGMNYADAMRVLDACRRSLAEYCVLSIGNETVSRNAGGITAD